MSLFKAPRQWRSLTGCVFCLLLFPAVPIANGNSKQNWPQGRFFVMDTATGAGQLTAEQQVTMVRELGFSGLGYWERQPAKGIENTRQMIRLLRENNLVVSPIYFSLPLDTSSNQWKNRRKLVSATIALLEPAETIWLSLGASNSNDFPPSSFEHDNHAASLVRNIADEAAARGVRVSLYPHINKWLETIDDAVRLIRKIHRPNVGITFNLYHFLKTTGQADLRDTLTKANRYLDVVTINGSSRQGSIEPLGQGDYDPYWLLKSLKDLGYRGPVGFQGYGIGGDRHQNLQLTMKAWKELCDRVQNQERQMIDRAILNSGNTARLMSVIEKAKNGEEIVIGTIGGSITAGAAASAQYKRYPNLIADWWQDTFPTADVRLVNAGIGATGSYIGAHRVETDLLIHEPDLVICEFAVNDNNIKRRAESLEGLVRQVLKSPARPAVILLMMVNQDGNSAQSWHSKVGYHYDLGIISFTDAVWPEIQKGTIKWQDIEADMVHPNDRGHRLTARLITAFIDRVRLGAYPPVATSPQTLPEPLISDVFEHTKIINFDNAETTLNKGWTKLENAPLGNGWQSNEPQSVLKLRFEAQTVGVVYHRIKDDMGIAAVSVDEHPPVRLNGWFEQDWGGYSHSRIIARRLPEGEHTLSVELLDDKAEQSKGHRFNLEAVLLSGVKQ